MEKITKIKAIKEFFEADGGRPVTMNEMRELTADDRNELGVLAAKALGKGLEVK